MAFECTVRPETCPPPRVCYYNITKGSIVGTFCECSSVYGYEGLDCLQKTVSTDLYISFYFLHLLIFGIYAIMTCSKTISKCLATTRGRFQKTFANEVSAVIIVSQIGLVCVCISSLLTLIGLFTPNLYTSRETDGVRQPFLYRVRNTILCLSEILQQSCCFLISGTWYKIATNKHMVMIDFHRIRVFSFLTFLSIAIIGFTMQGIPLEKEIFMFFIVVETITIIIFGICSQMVQNELNRQVSSSARNSSSVFETILKRVRFATRVGMIGSFSSLVGSWFIYAEPPVSGIYSPLQLIPLWSPAWPLITIGISLVSLALTTFGNNHISTSSDKSGVSDNNKNPSTSKVGNIRSRTSSYREKQEGKTESLIIVASPQ